MALSATKFSVILWGLARVLNYTARKHPEFRERLKERNLVAQIMARDEEIGRWFEFRNGKVRSGFGSAQEGRRHAGVQERRARRRPADAADQLARPDQRAEGFQAHRRGPRGSRPTGSRRPSWRASRPGSTSATQLPDGSMRYCNMTNGGPVFVYVKDGKIVRMTPIDFAKDDGALVDHPRARHGASRRRARPRLRRTGRTPSRSSIRRTGCCIR